MNPYHNITNKNNKPRHSPTTNSSLRILYWNADSISSKFDQLKYFINNYKSPNELIHIIAINEAKLSLKQTPPTLHTTSGIYSPYYFPSVYTRKKTALSLYAGGLLFYIHSTIQNITFPPELNFSHTASKHLNEQQLESTTTDIVWAIIKYGKSILKIGLAYLHPNTLDSVYQAFTDNIQFNIENTKENTKLILGGDFNLKHPTWSRATADMGGRSKMADKFSNFIDEYGLVIMNSLYAPGIPTLHSNKAGQLPSTVDLVLVNSPDIANNLIILQDSGLISDHKPLLASIDNLSETQRINQNIQNKICYKWASNPKDVESWIKFQQYIKPILISWTNIYEPFLNQSVLNECSTLTDSKSLLQSLIEESWNNLLYGIIKTAEITIGKKPIGIHNQNTRQISGFNKYKDELLLLIKSIRSTRLHIDVKNNKN
jgi:exonuclease III